MLQILLKNATKYRFQNKCDNMFRQYNSLLKRNFYSSKKKSIEKFEPNRNILNGALLNIYHNKPLYFSTNQNVLQKFAQDINTKVTKDVILFKYNNPRFFNMLNLFAICQFCFWAYLSHFAYTSLKDAPIDKIEEVDIAWWRKINLGENKYRNGITILCFVIGYGILVAAWAFTLKSVRFLILRKGGDAVTFVTYGPFGKNRMMTVNLKNVSSQESRQNARVTLPVKVQNTYLYYMLDMRGEFTNGKLFDYTAGLKRILR